MFESCDPFLSRRFPPPERDRKFVLSTVCDRIAPVRHCSAPRAPLTTATDAIYILACWPPRFRTIAWDDVCQSPMRRAMNGRTQPSPWTVQVELAGMLRREAPNDIWRSGSFSWLGWNERTNGDAEVQRGTKNYCAASKIMPVIRDNNKSLSSLDVLSFCCIHQLKPFASCMGGASYNFGCEELRWDRTDSFGISEI